MEEKKYEEKKMDRKQNILLILGLFVLISMVGGVTYAFFNYTKTGSANTLKLGTISFSSSYETVTLTNVFPITSTAVATDTDNVASVTVNINGKTTYSGGVEYLVTLTNVNVAVGSKTVPVSLVVTPSGLGESDNNYFTNRGGETKIYKVLAGSELENNEQILVGFIPNSNTGTTGTVTIKAYLDSSKVAISDTYDGNETDNMGTTSEWVNGRTVLTTSEWNSLATTPISFKVKVEANEGVWVLPFAGRELLSKMSTKTACTTTAINNSGIGGSGDITYFTGAEDSTTEDCLTNYVWYSGKLWRITAIYPDGTMKLVTENSITSIYFGSSTTFNGSYIDQWLSQEFLPTLYNYQDIVVQASEWNVTATNATTDPYLNTYSITTNKTVGLLNTYEYTESYTGTTSSDGYLNIGQRWWLMNPFDYIRGSYVTNEGNVESMSLYMGMFGVRPSIYLKSSVSFTNINDSNAGKRNNPYRISEDKNTGANGEALNQRLSGEYVKLTDSSNNELLYRIIGIENGKTKIVSTSYLTNEDASFRSGKFGVDIYFNTPANDNETWDNQYWDNYLKNPTNGWLSMLSSNTQNMLDTGTYYLGYYPHQTNYKNAICATVDINTSASSCTKISDSTLLYTGTVGLLRAGEMMAVQQSSVIHINSSNSYKDMWLITPYRIDNTASVRMLRYDTSGDYTSYSQSYAVRPTLHLKPEVTIIGGSGTALDPYSLTLNS